MPTVVDQRRECAASYRHTAIEYGSPSSCDKGFIGLIKSMWSFPRPEVPQTTQPRDVDLLDHTLGTRPFTKVPKCSEKNPGGIQSC